MPAAVALAAAWAPTAVRAHHSFAAEYDTRKPVELKGTVTGIDWVNPHARTAVGAHAAANATAAGMPMSIHLPCMFVGNYTTC